MIESLKVVLHYTAVDLTKFIASIFIVGLHSHVLASYGGTADYIYQVFSRFAVPFFFISSSFFLYQKSNMQDSNKVIFQYAKRILKMYLFWFIVYIPLIFYLRIYPLIIENCDSLYILRSFIRDLLFSSTFPGSWYLIASVWCAFILHYLSKYISLKLILGISLLLYLLPLMSSAYYGIVTRNDFIYKFILFYEDNFSIAYFSYPAGLLYFAIGKFISVKQEQIVCIGTSFYVKAVCLSLLAAFIEMGILGYFRIVRSSDVFISLIPLSLFLFLLVLSLNLNLPKATAVTLRKASTIIYLSYFMYVYVYEIFLTELQLNSILRYILTLVFCFITIAFINYNEKRYSFLRYAY